MKTNKKRKKNTKHLVKKTVNLSFEQHTLPKYFLNAAHSSY